MRRPSRASHAAVRNDGSDEAAHARIADAHARRTGQLDVPPQPERAHGEARLMQHIVRLHRPVHVRRAHHREAQPSHRIRAAQRPRPGGPASDPRRRRLEVLLRSQSSGWRGPLPRQRSGVGTQRAESRPRHKSRRTRLCCAPDVVMDACWAIRDLVAPESSMSCGRHPDWHERARRQSGEPNCAVGSAASQFWPPLV